jgi:hypothetical protein
MTRSIFPQKRNKWQQDSISLLVNHNKLSLTMNKLLQFVTKNRYPVSVIVGSQIGRYAMRSLVGSSSISCFAGAAFAAWLCGSGPASAGDSGSDTAVQPALNAVCAAVGVKSCPHMPTVSQVVLEIAGLANAAPDFVRGPQGSFNIPPNDTGALCLVIASPSLSACDQIVIDAVNPPAASSVGISDLANLTALGFTTGKGPPVPVPLGTSGASSFFYAVATPDQNGEITTLTLYFDYPVQTNSSIQKSVFAKISLPLSNGQRPICGTAGCPATLATLQISGCSSGPSCVNGLAANVIGDFTTQGTTETRSAGSLGIQTTVSFAPSPNSASSHLILTVQVPLRVTHGNDPAYFGVVPSGVIPVNQLTGLPTAFTKDVVPASGFGVTPQAAPACIPTASNPNGDCPATTFPTTFPFCASFSGSGSGPLGSGSFHSAVAAFLSIGTDATTYASSPVSPAVLSGVQLQCPF